MIEERSDHAAVSMGNKMFVIGGEETTNCEVFDICSRKFTKFFSEIKIPFLPLCNFYAFDIGNNIVVFQNCQGSFEKTYIYLYDVEKEKWLNVQCDITKYMFYSSFVKYFS